MPSDHPIVLGFDTSAAHCAVALLQGPETLAHRTEDMTRGQAERLMPLLEETLRDAGLAWRDLAAIGVGIGPGNFTGIRISVSAARGLSLGLGIPAIGVSGLEALTHGYSNVIACWPAPRDSAYVQAFVAGGDPSPRLVRSADDLPIYPAGALPSLVGPGAETVMALRPESVTDPLFPLPVAIASIAAERLQGVAAKDIPAPAPLYLKPADAAPSSTPPVAMLSSNHDA
ncbi:tRNA (adenosine(37)-N6)-threonylcarbamoyltransferase complex dimerization subunit type 1 TsaB [Rhodobacteraceae bacterium D3-12]|nr:tRNA (adenosine(37)-N6)-threonylcarbamoyltransferase complex dimerization subunit type 1 TsaB [Rhodobacteraceae bacterium D3-12]